MSQYMFDVSHMDRRIPTAFDASSLTAFMKCPRSYAQQFLLGWRPPKKSAALTFGTLVHGGLETWYLTQDPDAVVTYLAENSEMADLDPEDDRGRTPDRVAEIVFEYIKLFRMEDMQYKVLEVEMPFELPIHPSLPDLLVKGKMDLVLQDATGNIIPVDWKTASYVQRGTWARLKHFTPQALLYTNAARYLFEGQAVGGFRYDLIHLKKKEVLFERYLKPLNRLRVDEWVHTTVPTLLLMRELVDEFERTGDIEVFPRYQGEFSCGRFGGCEFLDLCESTGQRQKQQIVQLEMSRSFWSPETGEEPVPFRDEEFRT